ncbi:MAG: Rieske 2Fe-2S domain-containing protein [Hyphomicrobium sp.]
MSWTRICKTTDVAPNSVKKIWIAGGIPVLVVNYGAGFRVVPPVCPHMEEPLEESAIVASCMLTCTKHLWAWNLMTLEKQGETEKPLKLYEVKEEDGELMAFVDGELLYDFDKEDDMDDDAFFKS